MSLDIIALAARLAICVGCVGIGSWAYGVVRAVSASTDALFGEGE